MYLAGPLHALHGTAVPGRSGIVARYSVGGQVLRCLRHRYFQCFQYWRWLSLHPTRPALMQPWIPTCVRRRNSRQQLRGLPDGQVPKSNFRIGLQEHRDGNLR